MEAILEMIRDGYDRVAEEYARRIAGELAGKPFDRAILDRVAEAAASLGPVCDLGCGPGHVAGYLHERGARVIGIDPSLGMLEQARRLHPGVEFRQDAVPGLPLGDESLGAIVAFYSLIHVPEEQFHGTMRDLHRVLKPGGVLLIAVHVGDEDIHLEEFWGHPVSLDFRFFQLDEVERATSAVGFEIDVALVRPPYASVERENPRAYVLARKPHSGALSVHERAQRLMARCDALTTCSDEPDILTRKYGTPALDRAQMLVAGWMEQAGLTVHRDAIGNVIGRRESSSPEAKTLLLGSHNDSVRDAGRYDGPMGVLIAIETADAMRDVDLPFALQVCSFADEEGLRFHTAYLGSKTLTGALDETILAATDTNGITLAEVIVAFGGDPELLESSRVEPGTALGYLEAHIEQGRCSSDSGCRSAW